MGNCKHAGAASMQSNTESQGPVFPQQLALIIRAGSSLAYSYKILHFAEL